MEEFGLKHIGKLKPRKSTDIKSSRIGVGFECLDREMWDPNQAWPVLNELGVKWARVQTGWARTEKEEGKYDFAWLDAIVDKIRERGVNPWLSLSYGNPVYTPGAPYHGVGCPPIYTERERMGWQNYVRALVTHFKGRVTHYEIWNEPDLLSFFKPVPRASLYVDFVRLTTEPLRAVQPDAKVIGGAIAWGMTPWSMKFFEDCLEAGMHKYIDIVTYHGYKSIPERHTAQEFPAFRHLIRKYKPELEFWQGEAGIPSYVPDDGKGKAALTEMKVSEPIQARMLLRRFLMELGYDSKMVSYFQLADFAHYATLKVSFHYGILRLEDGSPKPSYFALQSLASLLCDPLEAAEGRFSGHLSLVSDSADLRATKTPTWQVNLVKGDVPVYAWWQPEAVTDDPVWRKASLAMWMDRDLRLTDPVVIDPATQEVYATSFEMDKRTCAETWMHPDPEAEGVRFFPTLPISNTPLILTDRSIVSLL